MVSGIDFTKFRAPIKVHDNCTVIDVSSGAFPRNIEVRMTGTDGARRTAVWDGLLNLSNSDKVICHEYPGNPILRIVGFGGDQDAQSTTIWTRTGTEIDPTNDGDSLTFHDDAATERLELNPGTSSTEAFWETRDQTGALKLRLSTDNLYRFLVSNGGTDVSQNVFRVDVTGTPQLEWDESGDRFKWNKGHEITAGDVLIPDDLVHQGDPDTLISLSDDLIDLQAGGLSLLKLTETTQDLVEIGDVGGGGDVDVNINSGIVFVEGSTDLVGIRTTTPAAVLDVAFSGGTPTAIFGDGSSNSFIHFDGAAGSVRDMRFQSGGSNRWLLRVNATAESGSDVGSDLQFYARDDSGGALGIWFHQVRANGRLGLGGVTSPGAQVHIDQSSTAAAIPVLYLDQADVSEEFIRFVGTAASATLTQSIVNEGDVSTATRQGWLKVHVIDDGNQITDQDYFVPIYTLA